MFVESFLNKIFKEKSDIINIKNEEELKLKIDIFIKFLYVFENTEFVNNFKSEIERVIVEEGMLDLKKILDLTFILDTLKELTNKNLIEETDYYKKTLNLENNKNEIEDKLDTTTYWEYLINIIYTYINLTYKVKDEIYELYIDKKINIHNYIENIIKNYESKVNFKYIPSSVVDYNDENTDNYTDRDDYIPFIDINENEEIKRIKLIGYAGAGKTTTLEYIEYLDAKRYNDKKKIPLLIRLITVSDLSLVEDLICKKLNISDLDIVKYLIKNNRINLYLDGINEISITDTFDKRKELDTIENFINRKDTQKIKIIVTDRDNNEVSVLNNCENTFLIQGMTQDDIIAFIEGNSENSNKVKDAFFKNKELQNIKIDPLMLKNLIAIIESGEDIPVNLVDLGEVYLKAIINREINEKKEKLAVYINEVLTYYVSIIENNNPVSYFKIIEIFNDYFSKQNKEIDTDALLLLIKKMGILTEVEYEKYSFKEESFYNYYFYKTLD